jgi:hypothetical protein
MTLQTEPGGAGLAILHGRVPLWLKLSYTAFMAVLIPVYWHYYGLTNFLYFCDVALILTLVGIWTESLLLISMCAVGVMATQLLWVVDYAANFFGLSLIGLTDYMFESHRSLFLRGLSLFHGWLPFLLLFLVWRLGYDRRALLSWTLLAWGLLFICYNFMPPPQPNPGLRPVNINYVYGLSDHAPQPWVSPRIWFIGLLVCLPAVFFAPVHFLLSRTMPKPPATV